MPLAFVRKLYQYELGISYRALTFHAFSMRSYIKISDQFVLTFMRL